MCSSAIHEAIFKGFLYHLVRRGKSLIWSATCVDTFVKSHVKTTSKEAGTAARSAENGKIKIYENFSENFEFLPFADATAGNFGIIAKNFTNQLGQRRGEMIGKGIGVRRVLSGGRSGGGRGRCERSFVRR